MDKRGTGPGWYCCIAPTRAREVATDLAGPFDDIPELDAWLDANGITLLQGAPHSERPVPYFVEMTDDELEADYSPWATNIHYRGS